MTNSQVFKHELIAMLRSFSEAEKLKFAQFLSSPYFSFRKNLELLYNVLLQFHPLYTHVELTKEYIYQKVYPGKKYKHSSIRDLMSSLLHAARMFLAFEHFKDDNYLSILMIKELRERNLSNQLLLQLNKSIKRLENAEGVDPEFFMLKFNLESENINFKLLNEKHLTHKKILNHGEYIKDLSTFLIIHFVSQIITNYIYLFINAEKFSFAAIDKYIQNIAHNLLDKNLLIEFKGKSKYDFMFKVYRLLLSAFMNRGSWDDYSEYRKAVMRYLRSFSYDEASFHYSRLISCCILGSKYSTEKNNFNNELLKLYADFLDGNYFINKKTKYIQANLYRAIILHGIKMHSLVWLQKVISEAERKLHPDNRENMQNYARAYYAFAMGSYDEAFTYVNKLDLNYFMFKYDLYILKLRIYYDRGNFEAVLELIHAFRQFIHNDRIMPKERKIFHKNFVYYYQRLVKLSLNSPRIDADSLILKLKKVNDIYHKEWIMDKLEMLSKPVQSYRKTS